MNLLNKVYHNVRIRPLQPTDADSLYRHYLGQKNLAFYLTRQPHKSLEQSQDFVRRCIESYQQSNPSMLVFAVAEPDSNIAFGMLTLIFKHDHAEIHFGVSAQYSGLGICTQVCRAGVEYLMALDINDIRTQLHVDHIASRRVLEKKWFCQYCSVARISVLSRNERSASGLSRYAAGS